VLSTLTEGKREHKRDGFGATNVLDCGDTMIKKGKATVQYTNHAMNKNERCELCRYFLPAFEDDFSKCMKVLGSIAANGWCKLFKRSK